MNGKPTKLESFPRSRAMIADAIEEAIFDAFGLEPPTDNPRPIRNACAKEDAHVNRTIRARR